MVAIVTIINLVCKQHCNEVTCNSVEYLVLDLASYCSHD